MPPVSWETDRPRLMLGNCSFRLRFLARAVVLRCDLIMNYLARSSEFLRYVTKAKEQLWTTLREGKKRRSRQP